MPNKITLEPEIENQFINIKSQQDALAAKGEKFIHLPKQTYGDFTYEVHELENSAGEKGWILFVTRVVAGNTYIKKIGEGLDAEKNTTDWELYEETEEV